MERQHVLANPVDRVVRELLRALVSSAFDPAPVVFTKQHENGTAPIRRLLLLPPGCSHTLRASLVRNSFLAGCFQSTRNESVEHLIVGFGVRRGSTTEISAVRHEAGAAHRVAVPPDLMDELRRHSTQNARNEVIVFHNHPPNLLHPILDNEPLASTADRGLLLRLRYLEPLIALKTLLGRGGLRFYIGENGYVREFSMPDVLTLLGFARQFGIG